MATYQELRTRSQQVRDEQNIGGNTALRVGQLLMDIVKYFYDNDAAASEYLRQHFAMVNDGTQLLNWQQSPIVILHTMGDDYDDGDFSALSQGENYYRAGFIMEANGQGGGINGETPKANVLYVNLANDTLYTWNGASFDAITSGGGGSISGDDIIKNAYYSNGNLVLIIETEGGDKTVTIPVNFDASNYVPTSRTVNGKALSSNITLSQSDIPGLVAALAAKVGYSDDEWLQVKAGAMQAATAVPNTTTVNGKQLNDNIVIGMADIPGLLQAIANAGSGAVSVIQPADPDGTFTIRVGDTDYTINLNHTHENMAKLEIVDEEPSDPTLDTIYAVVDDATDPTEIQSLWIAGLEFVGGGGDPEPKLRFPSPNSQINVDDLTSGGLFIRGYNLSQPLLVAVTGDFTINGGSSATVQATDANAGTTLTLACTTQSYNATGSLDITSSEGINTRCSLIANVPNYESITAAVFRGAQWVNMGFSVGPNTSFEWDVQFEEDSQLARTNGTFFSCNSTSPNLFQANFAADTFSSMYFWVGSSNAQPSGFSLGRGVFRYANQNCSYRGVTFSPPEMTFTVSEFSLGVSRGNGNIFNRARMIVFGLKVYENGVLTHDFVPKKFGSVVGFYDNLTSAFVSSKTSTELEEYNS